MTAVVSQDSRVLNECAEVTCCRVLEAAGDARARAVLATAYNVLQEWAGRIDDPALRRSFLENVAANREIAAMYRAVA